MQKTTDVIVSPPQFRLTLFHIPWNKSREAILERRTPANAGTFHYLL